MYFIKPLISGLYIHKHQQGPAQLLAIHYVILLPVYIQIHTRIIIILPCYTFENCIMYNTIQYICKGTI